MSGYGFIKMASQGIMTLLLIMWYTLSISGLDVHHDHEHGRTYVVACAFGTSCEKIHPHSHCHDSEAEACSEDEDCCSDEFHLILSPGEDAGDSVLHVSTSWHMDFIPATDSFTSTLNGYRLPLHHIETPPDIPDILNKTCILRV